MNVQVVHVLTRWGTDPGKPEGASSEVSMCKHIRKTELAVVTQTVQVEEIGDVDISLTKLADVDGTLRTFRIVLNLGGSKQKKTESLNQRKRVNHLQHCVGLSVCVCALNMQCSCCSQLCITTDYFQNIKQSSNTNSLVIQKHS